MRTVFNYFVLLIVALAFACATNFNAVDIENGDMCSFCRMAISEKQFAAEIVTKDESVLKFDDIGCMLRYRKTKGANLDAAAIYVADSETKKWIKAEDAFFIRSTTVKTPMGGGIIAFSSADREGALRFSDLEKE